MEHLKLVGLLIIVAVALLGFAANSSATTISTSTGSPVTTPTFVNFEDEFWHVTMANSNANIECATSIVGQVESHGGGVTAKIPLILLSFKNCTNGWTVQVNSAGSFEVHWTSEYNGTLTSSGTTLTAILHTIFGDITCRYSSKNTFLGTITGGNFATVHLTGKMPFHSGGGLCGTGESQWSGSLTGEALFITS